MSAMITIVALDPVEVLFVRAEGGAAGARKAFDALEARLPSLRGRRFYGLCGGDGSYRACTARRDDDDLSAIGLPTARLPGGRYARTKLLDWSSRTAEIAPSFDRMAAAHPVDPSRPSIEFYRSEKELVLLLPIRPSISPLPSLCPCPGSPLPS